MTNASKYGFRTGPIRSERTYSKSWDFVCSRTSLCAMSASRSWSLRSSIFLRNITFAYSLAFEGVSISWIRIDRADCSSARSFYVETSSRLNSSAHASTYCCRTDSSATWKSLQMSRTLTSGTPAGLVTALRLALFRRHFVPYLTVTS